MNESEGALEEVLEEVLEEILEEVLEGELEGEHEVENRVGSKLNFDDGFAVEIDDGPNDDCEVGLAVEIADGTPVDSDVGEHEEGTTVGNFDGLTVFLEDGFAVVGFADGFLEVAIVVKLK